nr:hypothetical protein CFP56_12567 [Quercus suber]
MTCPCLCPQPSISGGPQNKATSKFKVNYDAAVFKTLNLAGIGFIIRDWRGEVTAAVSMPVPLSMTIADLEALACR